MIKKQVFMRSIQDSTYNGHYNNKIVLDIFQICVRVISNCVREKKYFVKYG